ncbi:hypothetical protein ISF_02449 [Cordyceps fumosorosea ARSEF 2679]|uniref:Uncharacterized protein n=1 Tax=Cordyceps fumosorosea (strain ARSEF 2679) TaxID=1081104 RepID=A0A168BS20_CORFA|nr:hypothetical protein ISF_02449 [Cordyceps fumosorosea ARSEF 2679]OAA70475.1 hypothetical protein ISF_02449 [Cordyceps fumosorosea ARSEF 2679]
MGGPLKNPSLAALQSRSRFCEGSMNDRASAAPPVRFLDPDSLAAFEQPVALPSSGLGNLLASHDTAGFPTSSSNTSNSSGSSGFSQAWSRKTGSKLFGQVWEGVRGRLRLRKGDDSSGGGDAAKRTTRSTPSAAISAATTTTAVTQTNAETITIYTDPAERSDGPPASRTRSRLAAPTPLQLPTAPIDIPRGPATAGIGGPGNLSFAGFQSARPSRDEVLASYKQLMADGFFHAHAIPSNRQGLGRPGTANSARPATSHYHPDHHQQRPPSSPPPEWPLTTPRQETMEPAMLQSPTSASSRGTKRAAAHDSDDDESMRDQDMDMDDDDGDVRVYNKENQAPPHPNTVRGDDARQPKKRLRRLASRESLFVSKTRAPPTTSQRSLSSATTHGGGGGGGDGDIFFHPGPPPAINKLQKRRPSAQQQQQRPRHVSDGGGSARVLRGKAAEERRRLRVVPDEGRGIPGVPAIPVRFTYGEDRENDGPWRGLRVR